MSDLPLTALDNRQQKLAENASRAFEQGNFDYVITACAQILQSVPACLPVRRLQRAAQLKNSATRGGWMNKTLSGLTALPFAISMARKTPEEVLLQADKILNKDPNSITGLQLLAQAAQAYEWPETAAFAHEAIRDLDPTNRENLLALGQAWLHAGKADAALRVADEILRLNPVDGEGQTLMRKASIARTTKQGRWEGEGNYREKLRDENKSAALERAAKIAAPESQPAAPVTVTPPSVDPLPGARELVERYPGDADARFRLAELLLAAHQIEPAIAQYQQAQKNAKLRSRALLGLARCFRARGLLDLAVTQLNTAKQESSFSDELKKEITYELGECFEQLKQPETAIAQFKEIYAEDIGFRDVAAKINGYYSEKPAAE
jgi:tetratricopeptide (TPR) repeat protein